jgi:signal transduction histidine kinase
LLATRSGRARAGLVAGGLAVVSLDFVLTLAATNFWAQDGIVAAAHPVLQTAVGINGQVLLALGVLIFVAWQTQRLRIEQHTSHFLAEGLALIAIVALTFLLCRVLYTEALKGATARELELAQNAVLAVPHSEALQIRGTSQDAGNAAYLHVQAHLTRFRDANPSIEEIFLWTIRNGEFVSLACSDRRDGDNIPPGHIFGRANTRDLASYGLQEPWRAGPFRGHDGFFTTVNERITVPGSDETFCWMRMDFNTRNWLSGFASRRILLMAAATLLCLVVLVGSNYRLRALDDIIVERGKQLAAEAERSRLGRDLHDDLGQLLSAINIQTSILAEEFDPESELGIRSRELGTLTQRAVEATRELAHGLVPEDGNFSITFRQFCQRIAQSLSVACEVDDRIEDLPLRRDVRVALMRVSQESINNATRHGHAKRIEIKLWMEKGALRLQIADNGSGIQRQERQAGLGTSVMRARIEEVGGAFSLESIPGSGVTVQCAIPEKFAVSV